MEKLLAADSDSDGFLTQTKAYIDEFSREGLRTLMLAKKDISEREYQDWLEKFTRALTSMNSDRETEIMNVSAEIEQDMTLVGSTAIEDKL